MKTQTFSVTLTFSDKITSDNDIAVIANNIAESIKQRADEVGISPDEADFSTTKIEVTPQFLPHAKIEILIP